MDKLPYIMAIDFDGTLVVDKYPEIGSPTRFFDRIMELRKEHPEIKLILWTCRNKERLTEAVDFCTSKGLHFDAINENLKEVQELFDGDTRKVYANEYWDDKVPFDNWMWLHGS